MHLKFQKITQINPYSFQQRIGFTSTFIPTHNIILIYGGCKQNDLSIFDLQKSTWRKKEPSGKKPPARRYHAAAYFKNLDSLIIYGGQAIEPELRSLEDFYVLSIEEWNWKRIFLLRGPSARQFCSLIPRGGEEFYVFGGMQYPNKQMKNDIWILTDFKSKQKHPKQILDTQCYELQTNSQSPKYLCSSTILSNKKLITLEHSSTERNNYNIWIFYEKLKSWEKVYQKLEFNNVKIGAWEEEVVIFGVGEQWKGYLLREKGLEEIGVQGGEWGVKEFGLWGQQGCHGISLFSSNKLINVEFSLQKTRNTKKKQPQQVSRTKPTKHHKSEPKQKQHNQTQQSLTNLEEYLIAIKQEQILSQQLLKKNSYLQQLYKQIQSYISKLHRQYHSYEQYDQNIEHQRKSHLKSTKELKGEYESIEGQYYEVCNNIRMLRSSLGVVHADFQKCMETQFDEEA